MKIQINSLEALERLIGGDTEVEIDIRNSVVQNFTNKYLKGVVTELKEKGLIAAAKTEVKKEMFSHVGYNPIFNDKYKKLLENQISLLISKRAREIVAEKLSNGKFNQLIDEKINRILSSMVLDLTDKTIEERAKQLINEKLNN